jgi:hypothetical protein
MVNGRKMPGQKDNTRSMTIDFVLKEYFETNFDSISPTSMSIYIMDRGVPSTTTKPTPIPTPPLPPPPAQDRPTVDLNRILDSDNLIEEAVTPDNAGPLSDEPTPPALEQPVSPPPIAPPSELNRESAIKRGIIDFFDAKKDDNTYDDTLDSIISTDDTFIQTIESDIDTNNVDITNAEALAASIQRAYESFFCNN